MSEYLKEILLTFMIFVLMGILKLLSRLAGSDKKLNLREKFNIFYINTVAGWGIYSGLVSYDERFGELPQKIFFIMSATFIGFNVLERLKESNFIMKIIELIFKK